jgi:hypothetical protein
VILEQDAIAAMVSVRKGVDLVAETLLSDDVVRMPEIDVEIPMAAFFSGIDLGEQAV